MELSRTTFDELRRLIHRLCGLVIGDEKEYLIRHRLEPLVQDSGCKTFEDFLAKLSSLDGLKWQEAVIEAITTRETSFFRDRHPFEAIKNKILPELLSSIPQNISSLFDPPKFRFLSCGAATGQEPYSLAISISEFLASRRPPGIEERNFSILATDISNGAIAFASAAKYGRRDIDRGLSQNQLPQYFEQEGGAWTVKPSLRQLVEFRRANLLQPITHLGAFHLILCRNVLIYFDLAARQRICAQFHEMLPSGGWLLLGSAESLLGIEHRFQSIRHGDTLLFRKV
jgi:chemotaxis protein methyltransferase CheR